MTSGALRLLALLLWGLAAAAAAEAAAIPGALEVEPRYVPIDMGFEGATIRVVADVPTGQEAAVRMMGETETLEMKLKGKVAYLLWMSVGEVTFEAVPRVYFVLTSAPLTGPDSAPLRAEWKLGYQALARSAAWSPRFTEELIRLKEREGCFRVDEGRLVRAGAGHSASTERLSGVFRLPARAPAGAYAVDLFTLRNQVAVHLGTASVRLEYVGLPRVLRAVALDHGLVYGAVAIVVALVAGLATGLIFRPARRRST